MASGEGTSPLAVPHNVLQDAKEGPGSLGACSKRKTLNPKGPFGLRYRNKDKSLLAQDT